MDRAEHARALAAAVAALETPAFPPALALVLRGAVDYSFTVAFGYRGSDRPADLFDDFPAERRAVFVTEYQAGPYLLDPFYHAATRPVADGLYRMRDLAPDRFYQGEYFRSYYARTGLAEEIGFFTGIGDGATVVLSLMRAERSFSGREIALLRDIGPVVQALIRRHWAGHPALPAAGAGAEGDALDRSFHRFGAGVLTPREREVAEFTLKGHSAEAVGRALAIAPGTVRIHRRNIYAKLGIGSQRELFSRFISTLRPE